MQPLWLTMKTTWLRCALNFLPALLLYPHSLLPRSMPRTLPHLAVELMTANAPIAATEMATARTSVFAAPRLGTLAPSARSRRKLANTAAPIILLGCVLKALAVPFATLSLTPLAASLMPMYLAWPSPLLLTLTLIQGRMLLPHLSLQVPLFPRTLLLLVPLTLPHLRLPPLATLLKRLDKHTSLLSRRSASDRGLFVHFIFVFTRFVCRLPDQGGGAHDAHQQLLDQGGVSKPCSTRTRFHLLLLALHVTDFISESVGIAHLHFLTGLYPECIRRICSLTFPVVFL